MGGYFAALVFLEERLVGAASEDLGITTMDGARSSYWGNLNFYSPV